MALAFDWLLALEVFAGVLALLVGLLVVRSAKRWRKLRRLCPALGFRRYMSLRWQGLDAESVATAYWAVRGLGHEADLDLLVSLAVLRVNVVKVAGALGLADKYEIPTTLAALGAAAMAGYDVEQVVQAARQRRCQSFGQEELSQLHTWGLERAEPAS